MDNEKAIRAAKLTLGGILEKRRAKEAKERAPDQIAPSKYLPGVPRAVHANGGPAGMGDNGGPPLSEPPVDLGQAREAKQLQTFHTGMMDDIHQRMTNAMEAHQKAVDQGVFEGYEIGDTLQGSAHPMRITGRYMQKWKPTSMALRSFERMNTKPTIIEHEGEQYIPMLRYETGKEGVDGFQQGSAYLDGVKAAGYQKMGGLRAVKARGGAVEFMRDNHPLVPDELYHGNALKVVENQKYHGNGNWSSELDQEATDRNIAAQDFREFKPSSHGNYGPGIYLTDKPEVASDFAQGIRADQKEPRPHGQVMKLHASIKQPFHDGILKDPAWKDYIKSALTQYSIPHGEDRNARDAILKALDNGTATVRDLFLRDTPQGTLVNQHGQHDIHDTIRRSGFDGIIAHRPDGSKEYVAFKPEQVKSALSARKFDPTSPDMTYADGGAVDDGKVVYQGRSKKGIQQFFNPNGHAWGTTDLGTAKLFAGQSETTYPNATPRRAETSYNGEVHKLRFDIKNPMRVDIKETLWDANKEKAKIEEAKAKGHDGLEIYHNPNKSDFVAFSPDQVEHLGSSTPETTVDHYADGGAIPQKTVKAYKLFRTKGDGKLYPLFVNADKPVPMGEWLEAEEGPQGKSEGRVKSKIGDLAYRPGWHAGDLPIATHIGGKSDPSLKKPDYRPDNHVWAEVEMAADKDWQSVADSRGKGVKAHITDQVPLGGFYRYKTNPNMTGNWLIGGNMKVNRVLPDEEVKAINDQAGTADLPRRQTFAAGGAAMFEGMHEDLQNEDGTPMDLWHGTPSEGFSEFKDEKLGSTRDHGFYGRGHYLTPDQEGASEYAGESAEEGTLMGPLHAALKNPYVWDASDKGAHSTLRDLQSMGIMKGQAKLEPWDNLQRHHIDPFMREMQKRGHDGVIVRTNDYTGEKPHRVSEVVVFKPSAIKHKDAKSFDPNDPNIYHARGGVAK